MEQADINFTFASPVVRWQNPTGQGLAANISFSTDVVSFRSGAGSYDLQLAVVEYLAASQSYQTLWSATRTTPWNGQIQAGSSVTLPNVDIGAGDSILFTMRINIDSPLGGNGSADWLDSASLTQVSAVPEPSTFIAGTFALLPLGYQSIRLYRRRCSIQSRSFKNPRI
jgi:hypothetical protein